MKFFRQIEIRDRGFESHSTKGYLPVFVLSCVGSVLERGLTQLLLPSVSKLHIFLLTHSWSWVLPEEPSIPQLLNNFPEFYDGTRRFISVFTRALQWTHILSQIDLIHTIPSYPSKIHFNIVHLPTPWSALWIASIFGLEKSASEEPAWACGYVPPKRRFTQDLHGATSQKTAFFNSTYWSQNIFMRFYCFLE
jgi:hypothetical protein